MYQLEVSMKKEANFKALLPIGVFLVLYLGLGILFEYVMAIPMGFYNIPIVVGFVIIKIYMVAQNMNVVNVKIQVLCL